jgi:predicted permease
MFTTIVRLWSRALALFTARRDDADLDQELEAHFSLLVEEHRRRGLTEQEARRAAHVVLGGSTQVREAHREVRGVPWIEECGRDVRYALRGFRRQPGFAAVAALTLAVGIGANAAVFSMVYGVLLRPLAYADPDGLMSLTRGGITAPSQAPPARWISLRRWEVLREATSFDVGLYRPVIEDVILAGREPEVLRGGRISANVLGILGVQLIRGRGFRAEEDVDGGPPVALISERLWESRFASDPSIVGRTLSLGSSPFVVVGILPATFQFPVRDIDVWFPQPANAPFVARQFHACCTPLMGIARVRRGATAQQAEAELAVLNSRYEPAGQRRVDAGAAVLSPFKQNLIGDVDTMLWMLLAAVGFVLLIACANVATLLMARATSRAREFAVRSALGASRWRVIRQLVAESLVLSIAGGALGLFLAHAGVRAVSTMTLFNLPRAHELTVSGPVLLWTMAITGLTGIVFGTLPSLQLLRPSLIERLRQAGAADGESRRRGGIGVGTRGVLVVTQVALSLVLLIGAALMAQTIARLANVDMGFRPAGLLTLRVPLPVATYDTVEKRARFFDELVARVQTIPGVHGATVVRALPTTGGLGTNIQIASQRIPDPGHVGQMLQTVAPGYFEVVGLALKQGRTFQPRDNAAGTPRVAIVNEAFARRFWPSYPTQGTPLGDHLEIPILPPGPLEIVGVVADVRHSGPAREPDPQIYIPDSLYSPQVAFLALRHDGDRQVAVDAIRAQIRTIDPSQSVTDVSTMEEILERSMGRRHLAARVLGLFAAAAVALALIGLYGVMAYSVAQRTQEIGVRRALGATHGDVLRMVVGQGLRVTAIGIVCGVAGAYLSTRLLESLLFQVSTTDLGTFLFVPALFVVIALLASIVPAWRAVRIDPVGALRL